MKQLFGGSVIAIGALLMVSCGSYEAGNSNAIDKPIPPLELLETYTGLPTAKDAVETRLPNGSSFWRFDDLAILGVTTTGSSSCPLVPLAFSAAPGGVLLIMGTESETEVCSADSTPTTSIIALPEEVKDHRLGLLFDEEAVWDPT